MSQQGVDLRRSVQILWRHKILVGVVVVLGILAGAAYAKLNPPKLTSTALVVLPQNSQSSQAANSGGIDSYTATQEVIATSTPVLTDALPHVRPHVSLIELRREIQVGSLTSYVISISAQGTVAADAEATANAVAHSYIGYIGSKDSPVGPPVPAKLLQPASSAVGLAPLEVLIIDAVIGAISGLLIGAVIALAINRTDRRLRERDEIANSIGIPVLASVPVAHPSDAPGWTRLLDDYQPGVRHALQLQKVLHHLATAAADADYGDSHTSGRPSVTILSLSSDRGALALGPQLAAFAASQGIATVLFLGPQQDPDATATLQIACADAARSNKSGLLEAIVSDDHPGEPPDIALTVVIVAVDGRSPRIPDTMATTTTLLGVSSGAATAEQLARVAVSADTEGREITGILVADPEPGDHTTGRIPQLSRPAQRRLPTRQKGYERR
jgi:capsular polysaccharide biosynthesis protein